MTFTRTSSVLESVTVLASVSTEPCTSALMIKLIVRIAPARMVASRLSAVTRLCPARKVCRVCIDRSSAMLRARSMFSTTKNRSPALGGMLSPLTITGVEAVAS